MTVLPNWREQLDSRQKKELAFAEQYAADPFGAAGHNSLLLEARLAELLDIAAGLKEPPPPPNPDDLRLTFGKHNGKTLPEILRIDRGYVEWLSENARDSEMRQAAADALRGPVMPMQLEPPPPEPPAEAAPGDLPF